MRLLALRIETKYFDKVLSGEKTVEYRRKFEQRIIDSVETIVLVEKSSYPRIAFATYLKTELVKLKDIPQPEKRDLRKYYVNINDNTDFHGLHMGNIMLFFN